MREHIQYRIEHKLPLSERERAYAILYMGVRRGTTQQNL